MDKTNDTEIKDEDLKEDDFTPEELEAEDFDWKAKAQELKGIAKRRATQLGKAKVKISDFETQIKNLKPESESKPQDKKPDTNLLERLDKLALKTEGIKDADEVELFNKWKEDTGREADDIVGNNIFKKELEELRTSKANLAATSDIKGETGKSGAKDNPDYWIAKATKGDDGKLRFPEEMPKELYSKVLDKLSKNETGSSGNLKFYNE